jgi:hypothetical protein
LILSITAVNAQPFTLNPAIVPTELKFEDFTAEGESKPSGRISTNKLTQETDTAYYYIGGLSIYGQTFISLTTAHEAEDLQIDLFKENWTDVLKTGKLTGKSKWKEVFRTEGDFGIRIITKTKPSYHALIIHTTNDIEPEMPSPFTNQKPSSTMATMLAKYKWPLVGGAALLLTLLFFVFKRRKTNTAAVMLLLILLTNSTAYAQDGAINTILSREVESEHHEAVMEGMSTLNEHLNTIRTGVETLRTMSNTQTLHPGECTPEFNTNSAAIMPSACADNGRCTECFTKAVRKLNFMRMQLGRLSCIYNNTKTYTEAAISFGDNASGVHGMVGLSWQSTRPGIVNAFESMKGACKEKYTGMMQSLDQALKDIDACEREYGLPDWYQRFGFIYFEFMKEKYKIVD